MSRKAKISGVALCLLASMGVLAALAQTTDKEPTELYVRTHPAGAAITVDGKQWGVSPKLFEIEPGDHTVVVKLAGHEPKTKKVTVRDGRIKRVVLRLRSEPDTSTFGPAIERMVYDDSTGKDWLIDLDTGKVTAPPEQLDPEKNREADPRKLIAWARSEGIDASGMKAGQGILFGVDLAVSFVNSESWEDVTRQQVRAALAREEQSDGDHPIIGGEGVSSNTLYAFRTCEGGVGVLQLVGRGDEDHPSVRIRYKLVSGTAASPPADPPASSRPAEGSWDHAGMLRRLATATCRELEKALDVYRLDMGTYPTTEAGLAALVEKPKHADPRGKWNGPYVSKLRTDPWGLPYRYRRVTEPDGTKTTIWSLGPDKRDNTNDDIRLGIDYDISAEDNTTTETPPQATEKSVSAQELGAFQGKSPVQVEEQQVRHVIATFAVAAVKGDKEKVAECLHPKMRGLLDELDEVAESVSAGLKLAEIHSVFLSSDRALVATEMAPDARQKSSTLACTVYTLVKVGESWVIEDIEMEDENGLAQRIGRFQGKSPVQVEEQKVRDVIAKFAQAAKQGDKAAVRVHLHPNMWNLLESLDLFAEMIAEGMKTDEIRSLSVDGNRASVATEMFVIGDIQMPPACTAYRLVKVHGSWLIEAIDLKDEKGREVKLELHLFNFNRATSNTKETPDEADRPASLPAESAEKILRNYSEAVWAGALPLLDSAEPKKVQEMIQQVATTAALRHIMADQDVVVKYILDRFPDAEPVDPSQWTEKSTSQPDMDFSSWPVKPQAFWHPVVIASFSRNPVIARSMGIETFGKRALVQAIAPGVTMVLDRSLDRPVIATAFGDKLLVVHLRRGSDGSYGPEALEWLKRKPSSTQNYHVLPANPSEAQRIVHAFRKEAWATLLPRLQELDTNEVQEELATLATRHFAGKQEIFAAEAARRLAELPDGEPFQDRDQWIWGQVLTYNLSRPVSCSLASLQPDGSFFASFLGKQPVFHAGESKFPASLLAAAVVRSTDRLRDCRLTHLSILPGQLHRGNAGELANQVYGGHPRIIALETLGDECAPRYTKILGDDVFDPFW